MRTKIVTDYHQLSDYKLTCKTRYIARCVSNVKDFSPLKATLYALQDAIKDFNIAVARSKSTHAALFLDFKAQKKKSLLKELKWLGFYVNFLAKDSHDVILSSGFDLNGPPRPKLHRPTAFCVVQCGKGKVKLSCAKVKGAFRYYYEYRTEESTTWEVALNGRADMQITGLKTGCIYKFRVQAVDSRRKGEYSKIVTIKMF